MTCTACPSTPALLRAQLAQEPLPLCPSCDASAIRTREVQAEREHHAERAAHIRLIRDELLDRIPAPGQSRPAPANDIPLGREDIRDVLYAALNDHHNWLPGWLS